jgi:hypothetical protein
MTIEAKDINQGNILEARILFKAEKDAVVVEMGPYFFEIAMLTSEKVGYFEVDGKTRELNAKLRRPRELILKEVLEGKAGLYELSMLDPQHPLYRVPSQITEKQRQEMADFLVKGEQLVPLTSPRLAWVSG